MEIFAAQGAQQIRKFLGSIRNRKFANFLEMRVCKFLLIDPQILLGPVPLVSLTPAANLPPVSLTPVANLPPVSTTLVKLVAKFAAGVIDTGGKFATGVYDTGGAP